MDQITVMNRLGRGGCVVAAMAIGLPAFGQTAYFSLQGEFLNVGDQYDFNFNLSRTVDNTEDVRFTTYASNGGTNSAFDTVGSGGIDSVLDLTDSTLFQHGFNDDTVGLDSRIGWTQATGIALNPNPLPIESYRLNMFEFNNDAIGAWAVDLVAPADAITLTGVTPTGSATATSLKFGTVAGTDAATFNQVATLNLTGPMVVAQTGKAVFTNTGSTTVGGQIDVKVGGILNANAGTFNANSSVNLNGGTLNANFANFTLASGKTLAASNNAQVNTSSNFFLNGGRIVHLSGGADMTHTSQLSVGALSTGTLTVTGPGSTLTQTGSLLISQQGGTGSLSVTDNASMDVNGFLTISGFLAGAGTDGTLDVLTGGDVTADTIRIGYNDGDQGTGTLTVDGTGSTVVQSGASTLTVGNADTPINNGSHTIHVQNGGSFTTGTGAITVNKTGDIGVYGGTFTANGATILNNGVIDVDGAGVFNAQGPVNVDGANGFTSFLTGSSFNLATGQMFTASNSAIAYIGDSYELDDATTFTINSDAGFYLESDLNVGNGTDGTLIVDGAGSQLLTNQSDSAALDWGQDGADAVVTVRNQGKATIGNGATLRLARTGAASTSGTLNVESGGTFNANSIELAVPDSATSATITVTGTGSTLTQSGASTLTVGSSGTGAATINVQNDGVFTTGTGTTNINATGTLNLPDDGIFNANGNVNIDGGTINAAFFNTFRLAAGKTMTLSNNAQYNGGNYGVDDGTTLNVLSGSDLILPLGLDVGFGSNGTLVVDGTGSSVTSGISFTSIIGAGGVTGNATFRNNAAGDFQQTLQLAWGTDANTTGNLNVLTGADITTLDIKIAAEGTSGGSGTLTVNGSGSTLTQSGASTLTLGHATDGSATVNVQNAGVFTTGTGATTINATGTLSINTNGGFNADGDINLNAGGTLNINSGGQLNLDGTTLNINASANFDAAGGTVFLNNNGVFNGAAITSQAFGTLHVENGATANLGTYVSADILIQDDGILNLPATTTSQFVVNDVQDFNGATFNGSFYLGDTAAGPSAASMFLGTNDVLTVKGLTSVGLSKAASLSVNDGTFHADGGLLLGYSVFGGAGSPGTVTVNAGTLNASNAAGLPIALGVGGIISLGNSPGNALILNDGELNVNGLLYVAPGNSFTMADGELDAGALVNEGTVNITGGHVKLNTWVNGSLASPTFGVVDIAAASLTIGTTRTGSFFPLLPIINIGTGESLSASSVDVGVEVDATLNIFDGGVVTTTASSDVGNDSVNGSTGTVNITGAGSVWNAGGGGGLDIVRGTLNVSADGSVVTTSPTGSIDIFEDGVLRGNGTLIANDEVYNEGVIILESDVDAFTVRDMQISGNYTQDADGKIEIGVTTGADTLLEQLIVANGLVTLAGELAFDPLADYSNLPLYSSGIGPVLRGTGSTTIAGTFDAVTGADLDDGTYNPGDVEIQRAILGDLNLDGYVGIDDLNAVLAVWNQNVDAGVWSLGDPSGDGFVGIDDLGAVLANWNNGTPPPPIGQASIPEPATLMFLATGFVGVSYRRR